MISKRDFRRLTRGLRFRLTVASALFFAVLLVGMAGVFRQVLSHTLDSKSHQRLDDQWGSLRSGYLEVDWDKLPDEPERAYWIYDDDDPDDRRTVYDLQQIYLVTDALGNIVQDGKGDPAISPDYKELGSINPNLIRTRVAQSLAASRQNPLAKPLSFYDEKHVGGDIYLLRSGVILSLRRHLPYYLSIGVKTTEDQGLLRVSTIVSIAVIPAALILASLLGWFMAGRALTPVKDVALAAQRISGSNLSLRIATREAGDELDYLILTFNRMIERLEASFQQMKQFSTDVSHELRTPITGIRGQLEVALFTAKTTEQYREAMFNALQDIDRLSQIVRALLLLSQAESGQLALQKSHLNLREVAVDLVDQFQIPAEAAGVRLEASLPEDCFVEGDRVQIERMITNLLSNALKFTPEGGQVRLSLISQPERVELTVEDTGRGIATEHLPHIFDRFYRVPGSASAPNLDQGLGLGLSFVAWIVKAHHGKIEVDSAPGKGTRFTISLPAAGVKSDTMELAGQPAGRS